MKVLQGSLPILTPMVLAHEFWASVKKGKLIFQYCPQCKMFQSYPRTWCSPRPWCSECGSEELTWKQISGEGTVYSYTIPRQVVDNSSAFEDKLPFVVAIVKLKEGPRLYSYIIGLPLEEVKIGVKVRVTFEDVSPDIALPKFQPLGFLGKSGENSSGTDSLP